MTIVSKDQIELPGGIPAEYREFLHQGTSVYTVYFHLLDGYFLDYLNYADGRTVGFLFDNMVPAAGRNGEQLYIRFTSEDPILDEDGIRFEKEWAHVFENIVDPMLRAE